MSNFEIQSLFYQGAYRQCISLASSQSSDPSNPATQQNLLYAARSHVALGDASSALSLLPASLAGSNPAVGAVRQLATFVGAQKKGDAQAADEALASLAELLDEAVVGDPRGEVVRVCAATAMARDGDPLGALEVLDVGSGNGSSREIECIALGVHILLSINRQDLAQKEFSAARGWADDSLLIQVSLSSEMAHNHL
jgi:coatomer subunit epsilon